MSAQNSKTEAERATAFIANVTQPGLFILHLNDGDAALTVGELRAITLGTAQLYVETRQYSPLPSYLLMPICAVISTQHTAPRLGLEFTKLCAARLVYATEQLEANEATLHDKTLLTRSVEARTKMFSRAMELYSLMDDVSNGWGARDTFSKVISTIISAVMVEVASLAPNFNPTDLFRKGYPVTPAIGDIMTKWMESCNIPTTHFK